MLFCLSKTSHVVVFNESSQAIWDTRKAHSCLNYCYLFGLYTLQVHGLRTSTSECLDYFQLNQNKARAFNKKVIMLLQYALCGMFVFPLFTLNNSAAITNGPCFAFTARDLDVLLRATIRWTIQIIIRGMKHLTTPTKQWNTSIVARRGEETRASRHSRSWAVRGWWEQPRGAGWSRG